MTEVRKLAFAFAPSAGGITLCGQSQAVPVAEFDEQQACQEAHLKLAVECGRVNAGGAITRNFTKVFELDANNPPTADKPEIQIVEMSKLADGRWQSKVVQRARLQQGWETV